MSASFIPCPGDPPRAGLPLLLVAAGALVNGGGRVLVARRPAGKHLAGLWEFPGGKVEPGEAPAAALVRELAEELGVETGPTCLTPCGFAAHDYDDFHLLMLLFACRNWAGRPEGRQGQAVKWIKPQELFALDMPPADRPLLGQLVELI